MAKLSDTERKLGEMKTKLDDMERKLEAKETFIHRVCRLLWVKIDFQDLRSASSCCSHLNLEQVSCQYCLLSDWQQESWSGEVSLTILSLGGLGYQESQLDFHSHGREEGLRVIGAQARVGWAEVEDVTQRFKQGLFHLQQGEAHRQRLPKSECQGTAATCRECCKEDSLSSWYLRRQESGRRSLQHWVQLGTRAGEEWPNPSSASGTERNNGYCSGLNRAWWPFMQGRVHHPFRRRFLSDRIPSHPWWWRLCGRWGRFAVERWEVQRFPIVSTKQDL